MQCEIFETRLNQILDRRQRPETDNELLAHAQECEACRDALAAQEFLFEGLELLETPELSPGFARRVVASALAEAAPSPRAGAFRPTHWLALSAIAAAIVVAVVSAPFVWNLGDKVAKREPTEPVVPPPAIAKSNPAIAVPPTLPQNGLVQNVDYREMFEQFPNNLPEAQRDALQSVEQIPGGLRPITNSFGVAVGLIRNTLPRAKDEQPPRKPQAAYPSADWAERMI